jgi:hypothetical protein
METMETLLETKKNAKTAKNYYCEFCDYSTANKTDFTIHQSTRKHVSQCGGNQMETESRKIPQKNATGGQCEKCQKLYKTRSGLWKHQRICMPLSEDSSDSENAEAIVAKIENPATVIDKDMFMELIRQNKDIQNVLMEQNNKLMEELKEARKVHNTIHHTTTTTNSNNNNRLNLNLFLNERCKDAINLNDFITSLKVTVADLERTGKLGYVEGISNIFVNGLRELDVYTRPIHCTDLKRETVYIREQNRWEKETDDKARLTQAVKRIASKNLQQIKYWQEENPEFEDLNSEKNDHYFQLSKSSLGGYDNEEDKKFHDSIIRNVLKETKIPNTL